MALNSQFELNAIAQLSKVLDLSSPSDKLQFSHQITLADGVGAGQADLVFHDQLTLSGSAQSLDLTALSDPFGDTANFAKVKMVVIENLATSTGYDVNIGGDPDAFMLFADATDELVLPPKGVVALLSEDDGWTVTGGTGDILTLDPGAESINVNVIIIGTSS